jgi:hypothetical protein
MLAVVRDFVICAAAAGAVLACAGAPPPETPPASATSLPADPEIEHSDPSHDLQSDLDAKPSWTGTLGVAPRVAAVVEAGLPDAVRAERGLLLCRYYVENVDRRALIARNREADIVALFEFANGESATVMGKRNTSNGIVSLPNAPLLGTLRVELSDRNFARTRHVANFSIVLDDGPRTEKSAEPARLICRAAPESWAVAQAADALAEADAELDALAADLENDRADFSTDPPFGGASTKVEEAAAFIGWGHALVKPRTTRYAELREAWIAAALESQPVRTVTEALGADVSVSPATSVRISKFECAGECVVELTANHGEPDNGRLVRAVEVKWVDANGATESFEEKLRTYEGAEVEAGLFVKQRGEVGYHFESRGNDWRRFRFLRVKVDGGQLDLEPGEAPASKR